MRKLEEITVSDIEKMDYNNIISLVKETNRPPGGYKTIARVINNTFLNNNSSVLEIGTSTGVTAIEIAKRVGCKIEAIDINKDSLEEASIRAAAENVHDKIEFRKADAQNLAYDDNTFDLVFCGNVTSLIPDREAARHEYERVLRQNGFLAAVPMYYVSTPPANILNKVRAAIQADVDVVDKSYWLNFYNKSGLVLKYMEDYRFDWIPDKTLDEFISFVMNREFLTNMHNQAYKALYTKYRDCIYLFRDNLSHMGYSILLYCKELVNREPELFHGSIVSGGLE